MKRSRKKPTPGKVYYEKVKEDYLKYDGKRGDFLRYQEAMVSFVLPSRTDFLLEHLHGLCAFLDDVFEGFYQREVAKERDEGVARFSVIFDEVDEEGEDRVRRRNIALDTLNLAAISDTIFQWHGDVMTRQEPMTGLYAVCYFLSWASYGRAFHLFLANQPEEKVAQYAYDSASDHRYCQMLSKRTNVVISDASLINYSVEDMWTHVRIIITSLYTFSFSIPMRTYIYALFLRYADLISVQQEEHKRDEVFDNPRFVTQYEEAEEGSGMAVVNDESDSDDDDLAADDYDAYKKIKIRANEAYSINNDFLYEGDALFFHQLYRLRLSTDLERHHREEANAIRINYTHRLNRIDFVRLAMEAWGDVFAGMTRDTQIKDSMVNRYTMLRTEMHLYHGDRERYRRSYPASACDANDVLLESRPLETTRINNTGSMMMGDIISCFKKYYAAALHNLHPVLSDEDYEKYALEEGDESWPVLDFEQEALLLTRICTRLFFELGKVKRLHRVDDCFLLEELVSLQRVDEVIFLKEEKDEKAWPVFLKLMRLYYVVDTVGKKVFKSLFFVEAYFVWLTLCRRKGVFSDRVLPVKLLDFCEKLNDLI